VEFSPPESMDESGIAAREERELLAMADTPSYVRRALRVEEATRRILARCETVREHWQVGVRLRLRNWNRLVQDEPRVGDKLDDAARTALCALNDAVFHVGESRTAKGAPAWPVMPGRMWNGLSRSVTQYNARWRSYLATVDLASANETIDAYNRYYLFEKECAMRSARLARIGFQPLPPLTPIWLECACPPLPELPARHG
jgi:hypothetical protein